MPLPEFSELTFGFAFLREFERYYTRGGYFPAAPDFITQAAEADKGYDVGILDGATPVYFQFKRSFVVRSQLATEFARPDFRLSSRPIYRMHLLKKAKYRQHKALQRLQNSGEEVLYVTSQVPNTAALNRAFLSRRIVDEATALFSPKDISLPNETKQHWVSFEANASVGYVYSREGTEFKRSIRNAPELAESRLPERAGSVEANLKRLTTLINLAARIDPRTTKEIRERFENPIAQASVAAACILDAHLTLFHGFNVGIHLKPGAT
ncbi:hypothetical protein H9L13_07745 [Sphingomonas lutea]|uniref:Uncharacterized protein n=1 Tax=Sphingomonas lutea TaxID=1045317 RepID=A0A7G9SFH9_9SPHN|nr:hypothetical protein [Sphingomonas lutea]QNN66604.1 hypothetical protein H9L13_07745 [Sphingomonas lutea]